MYKNMLQGNKNTLIGNLEPFEKNKDVLRGLLKLSTVSTIVLKSSTLRTSPQKAEKL